MTIAVCPGSFDPVTSGHLDVIERASKLFDQVIVAVAWNIDKHPLFSLEERKAMLEEVCARFPNVTVDILEGLLVHYARAKGAKVIVKGLRAISDFENEFQQALMNSKLEPGIETVFLMSRPEHSFLRSSLIKEVARTGGCIRGLVPPEVEARVLARIRGGGFGDGRSETA